MEGCFNSENCICPQAAKIRYFDELSRMNTKVTVRPVEVDFYTFSSASKGNKSFKNIVLGKNNNNNNKIIN